MHILSTNLTEMHCHILPNVDDGPETIALSEMIIRKCLDMGIETLITTPHYIRGKYENKTVKESYESLIDYLATKKLPMKIYLGNEIKLEENTLNDLKLGLSYTLANSNYVLIELSSYHYYPIYMEWMYKIQLEGYQIIIAHIDRYEYLKDQPKLIDDFLRAGFLIQINAKALIELKSRKRMIKLIMEGKVHFVSSDFHDLTKRVPVLNKAYKIIENKTNSQVATQLCGANAQKIIQNIPFS